MLTVLFSGQDKKRLLPVRISGVNCIVTKEHEVERSIE